MTCEEARSEILNKQATIDFASNKNGSIIMLHDFLDASDYTLRSMTSSDEQITLVYVANTYPKTCGIHLPGFDGNIIRVQTDISGTSRVIAVN
ncbi:hypothetical protein RCCS2_02258 [Roseobacter sp. CCS2]|nr:hypothetical protein RCCS2_02258 [Roseobacter sp. CCS2]